jgi:hypothetical protein
MPPEGYETVTLPVELCEDLDSLSHMSRPATIRTLIEEYPDEIDNAFRDDLRDQLDRIESAATTAEARTGRIEGALDDMGAGR